MSSGSSSYIMPLLVLASFVIYVAYRFYLNHMSNRNRNQMSWVEQEQRRIRRRRRTKRLTREEMEKRRELVLKQLVIKILPSQNDNKDKASQKDDKDEETPQVKVSFAKELNKSGHTVGNVPSSSGSADYVDTSNSKNENAGSQGNILTDAIRGMTSLVTWPAQNQDSFQSTHDYDEAVCPICLEPYKEGDEICWSSNDDCPHSFHLDCMMKWLMTHDNCPLCRADYLNLKKEEEDETGSADPAINTEENTRSGVGSSRDLEEGEQSNEGVNA